MLFGLVVSLTVFTAAFADVTEFLRSAQQKLVAQSSSSLSPQVASPTLYFVDNTFQGTTTCVGSATSVTYTALNYCYPNPNIAGQFVYNTYTVVGTVGTFTQAYFTNNICSVSAGTSAVVTYSTLCSVSGTGSMSYSTTSSIPMTGYLNAVQYIDSACSVPVSSTSTLLNACISTSPTSSYQTCSGNTATVTAYSASTTCTGSALIYTNYLQTCTAGGGNNPSLYSASTCPNSDSTGSISISLCFAGSETVQLASGETKMLSEVLVGDRVLAADSNGNTKFSEVVAVPHPANQQAVTFTHLQTEAGRDIKMTGEHLLPVSESCSGSYSLVQASSVQAGSCVQTVTGAEKVSSVSEVQGQGVYSVVTKEEMVVVNGIVASPFARNHAAAHAWYNIVRVLYSVAPAMFQNNWVKNANLLFGNVAASF